MAPGELFDTLESVCEILSPHVDFDAIGVVRLTGGRLLPHEIHLRGVPRDRSQSVWQMLAGYLGTSDERLESKATAIYEDPHAGLATILHDGATQVVNLLLERRFPEDQMFYEHGVRSYVRIAAPGAVLEFFRLQHGAPAIAFTESEAKLLEEAAAAIAANLNSR